MLPALIECLDVASQILNVTTGQGESLVGPVKRRVVQLLRRVLLYEAPGFCEHTRDVLYLELEINCLAPNLNGAYQTELYGGEEAS